MGDDSAMEERLRAAPLVRLVTAAGHVVNQRFTQKTSQQDGLTAAGSGVLAALARDRGAADTASGRTTHAELARRCLISPATLTSIVDTLEKAGYVRRERDIHDRRVVWLVITEAGARRAAEIGPQLRAAFTPTTVEQEPASRAIIREYLIELIMKNRGREQHDQHGNRGRSRRPRQAIPQTRDQRR